MDVFERSRVEKKHQHYTSLSYTVSIVHVELRFLVDEGEANDRNMADETFECAPSWTFLFILSREQLAIDFFSSFSFAVRINEKINDYNGEKNR